VRPFFIVVLWAESGDGIQVIRGKVMVRTFCLKNPQGLAAGGPCGTLKEPDSVGTIERNKPLKYSGKGQ
jgi:hypothetical protein